MSEGNVLVSDLDYLVVGVQADALAHKVFCGRKDYAKIAEEFARVYGEAHVYHRLATVEPAEEPVRWTWSNDNAKVPNKA